MRWWKCYFISRFDRWTWKIIFTQSKREGKFAWGFKPIKDLIYEVQTTKNYELFVKLYNLGVDVVGIRTDAFIVNKTNFEKITENIEIIKEEEIASNNQFSTLGKYKIDTNKTLIDKHITVEYNTLENFETKYKNIINIDNEYDENELLAKTKDVNRTIFKDFSRG